MQNEILSQLNNIFLDTKVHKIPKTFSFVVVLGILIAFGVNFFFNAICYFIGSR